MQCKRLTSEIPRGGFACCRGLPPACRCKESRDSGLSKSARSFGPHSEGASPPERRRFVGSSASGASASVSHSNRDEGGSERQDGSQWVWWLLSAAAVGGTAYWASTPYGQGIKELVVNGPLGKSGFLAAFSLIFLSEIGDKTFFIAALLAMKLGRWVSFLGSVASLSVMTVVSVCLGAVFSKVPDALKSSLPAGELAGIALLLFFGVRTLRDSLKPEDAGSAEEEMANAEDAVKQAETSGLKRSSPIRSFVEVATLIFIAEWGDRSMLATVALGAAQNPVGVACGAIAGHTIATGIAVLGGALASKYISEKMINIVSGVLFIVFAIATAVSLL